MRVTILTSLPTKAMLEEAIVSDLYKSLGRNTGNLVYTSAVLDHVANEYTIQPWHANPKLLKETSDILIIPCANQLGAHTDLGELSLRLEKTDLPILAIGLGVQKSKIGDSIKLTVGTERWLRLIADRSPTSHANITLRGEETFKLIEVMGLAKSAKVIGCPSNFLSSKKDLGQEIAKRSLNINFDKVVTLGGPFEGHLKKLNQNIFSLAFRRGYPWLIQSPFEYVLAATPSQNLIQEAELLEMLRQVCPKMSKNNFLDWCSKFAVTFFELNAWIDFVKNYDLVIGPRIHGVMVPIQTGIPSVCFANDARTLELCQIMKIPHIWYKDIRDPFLDAQKALKEFDASTFDLNRLRLARDYYQFLQSAGLQPTGALKQLVN